MEHEQLKQGNYYHIYNRGNNGCRLFRLAAQYEHFLFLYDKYISPIADTLAWVSMGNHFHFVVYIKKDVVYKYSLSKPIASKEVNSVGWEKWFEEHKWETIDLSDVDADIACPDLSESKDAVSTSRSESWTSRPHVSGYEVAAADLSAFGAFRRIGTGSDDVTESREAAPTLSTFGAFRRIGTSINNVNDAKMKTPIPHRHFAHFFNAYSRYLQITTGRTGNLFERPFKRKIIHSKEYLKQVILYVHNNPVHHGFCEHPLEYPWSSYLSCLSEKPTRLKRDDTINLFGNKTDFESEHDQKMDISEIEKHLGIEPHFDFERPEEDDADADFDADIACPDLSGSKDVDRLGDAAADLSAFGEPDNVEIKEGKNVETLEDADVEADKIRSGVSGSGETAADLSALAAFRRIGTGSDNVKKQSKNK